MTTPIQGSPGDSADVPVAATHYPVSPYYLPPRGDPSSLRPVAVLSILAAVVLGGVCHVIRQKSWFFPIFEMFHGAGVGFAVVGLARIWKLRLPKQVGVVAGVAGFVSAASIHVFDYFAFAPPGMSFLDYEDARAAAGVVLGDGNLGYTETILFWILAPLATIGVAVEVARKYINIPLCERCRTWKEKLHFGPYRLNPVAATEAIAAGQPANALVPGDKNCRFQLALYCCPYCEKGESEIEVKVSGSWKEGRTEKNVEFECSYPAAAWDEFDQLRRECKAEGLVIEK